MLAIVSILPITRVLGIAAVATAVPSAIAAASRDFWLLADTPVMGQMALGDSSAPRLLTAPLTVLSPGPRLAGTPSRGNARMKWF